MKNKILSLAILVLGILASCGTKETKNELFNGENLDGCSIGYFFWLLSNGVATNPGRISVNWMFSFFMRAN